MTTYTEHLEAAKSAALAALADLLATTTDPVEKRRIATTILRIPTPKPTPDRPTQTRATQNRATGCPGFDGQPVQSTPDANRATGSPPALGRQPVRDNGDTRDAELHTPTAPDPLAPSPISPTQPPLPNPLDFIRQSNALLTMLSARPKRPRRRAIHAPTPAPSG